MKKFLLLMCILLGALGYTFAITQPVNEKNWVNYWYINDIYKKWSTYFLSVDYIQYYQWYEAALARAEDWVILWGLWNGANENYPKSYYTTDKNGNKFATKTIRKRITNYLTKIWSEWFKKLGMDMNTYSWAKIDDLFNSLSETERIIIGASYDPATWWGQKSYERNTNTKIRTIAFSPSAKISVEWKSISLNELVTWGKDPVSKLLVTKIFLKKSKIEWFRIEWHP